MKTFVTSANLDRCTAQFWSLVGVAHGQSQEAGSPFCSVSDDEAAQTSALFAYMAAFTSLLVCNAETYSQPLCNFTTAWQPDLPGLWASSWWYLQVEAAVNNHTPSTTPLAPPPFASAPNRARGCCPLQRGRG